MDHPAYAKLMEYASTPEALSASVDYLVEHLGFLKPNDAVLICFTRNQPNEIGSLFEKAVLAKGAVPPSDDEVGRNPRARSAKLRVAQKLEVE